MQIDLNSSAGLALALLPEIVLVAWGILVLLVAAWKHGDPRASRTAGQLSLVGILATLAVVLWMWARNWHATEFTSMMAADPFRYATDAVFLIAAALAIAISFSYVEREKILVPEYYAMLLFGTVGMMFMSGGADLIVVFVGLELMSICIYVLAGINRNSVYSGEAALKYFLLGAFASAFFLYGIALIYGATGTTNLVLISFQMAASQLQNSAMVLIGAAMLLIGFAFKVAAIPFHMWAPDVYDGSPTPIAAYMATAVKAAGFAALIRILLTSFGENSAIWHDAVWWLAALTMVIGNLLALAQRKLKRMLAYSSVGHAGYLLVAVASASSIGAAAFLFYILAYTLMTVGSFTVLAAVGRDGEKDVTINQMSGLASKRPWLAFTMMIFMLSLLGFPGTAGFMGKWYILSSAVQADMLSLAVVLVIASVISAGYYLPVVMAMYMKPLEDADAHRNTRVFGATRFVVSATAIALLLFGVWPNRLADAAEDGASNFRPSAAVSQTLPD